METYTRRSRIQSLKAELELRTKACTTLKREFERQPLSNDQQSEIFLRWEDAIRESQLIQALLEMLEREEKKGAKVSESHQTMQNADQVATFTWFYHAR